MSGLCLAGKVYLSSSSQFRSVSVKTRRQAQGIKFEEASSLLLLDFLYNSISGTISEMNSGILANLTYSAPDPKTHD